MLLRGAYGMFTDRPKSPNNSSTAAVRGHVRVAIVPRRDERLLQGPRRHPADQVPPRAGLVIRPGSARPAERLLADDRAGRLVVHVEVAGGVLELVLGELDRGAVAGEDGAGQSIRRGAVDELER